jgi:putative addiction module component (TIGR02574 family)
LFKDINMVTQALLDEVLHLNAEDRSLLADTLLRSLDAPDPAIEQAWLDEAERRLKAYDEGRIQAIPMEEVFRDL